ncbi:MAG: NAD(P)/FAD-dependent oxidoreductase [Vicinamibacterales bacterium]
MQRRRFVHTLGLAAASLATRSVALTARAPKRVAVVGGGIMGASIAYHLAKRGAEVHLFEKRAPASGATANSFAWINAGSKRPRGYFDLNHLGMAGWRRLQHELGPSTLVVQWGGTLQWQADAERAEAFRMAVAAQQAWGYSTRLVDLPEMRRLVPALEPGPVSAASFCDEEGTVDPVGAARLLLDAARRHGAVVQHPAAVSSFDMAGSLVKGVRVNGEAVAVDTVVIAAGVEMPELGTQLGLDIPMEESPGLLAHTRPHARLVDRVLVAPGATLKQLPGGEIVAGVDFGGSPSRDTSAAMGARLLEGAGRFVPRLREAALDRVTLGFRVLPADGQPIIGRPVSRPNVYLAAMHSGITLCPAVGQLAAIEILDQVEVDVLKPYRLERFARSK